MAAPSGRVGRGQGLLACIPFILQYVGFARGQSAIHVAFNGTAGPDGPWNVIQQRVDFPDQYIQMLPSLTNSTVLVPASACQQQDSQCPLPLPGLWEQSGAQALSSYGDGVNFSASSFQNARVLNLTGTAIHMLERVTFAGPIFVDNHGVIRADDVMISFPGGASYTMDTGFLSLNGADQFQSWQLPNGSTIEANRTLPSLYVNGHIPSVSYGMHIGSAEPNVTGSLYLGGYDSSRIIGDVVNGNVSGGNNVFTVNDIFLGVQSGGSAFLPNRAPKIDSLIDPNNAGRSISVRVDPGVPYMYLPAATCKAINDALPTTFDQDTGLYRWKTGNLSTTDIISSPHYIGFTFGQTTISVPFALLNLTLQSPITSREVQYFPCNNFNPADNTYVLGRAFLQAAFLGQNWHSGGVWLAQAPGPDGPSVNVKNINSDDISVTGIANPPAWADTWKSLKDLTSTGSSADSNSSSGLSSGAKVGIGVGVGVGVAVLAFAAGLFLFFRRRKQRQYDAVTSQNGHELQGDQHFLGQQTQGGRATRDQKPPQEMDTQRFVAEMPAQEAQELDGTEAGWERDKPAHQRFV